MGERKSKCVGGRRRERANRTSSGEKGKEVLKRTVKIILLTWSPDTITNVHISHHAVDTEEKRRDTKPLGNGEPRTRKPGKAFFVEVALQCLEFITVCASPNKHSLQGECETETRPNEVQQYKPMYRKFPKNSAL